MMRNETDRNPSQPIVTAKKEEATKRNVALGIGLFVQLAEYGARTHD
jgi:hypothetical protein